MTARPKNESGMLLNRLGINEDTLALPGSFFDKKVCHARICFAPLLARFSSVVLFMRLDYSTDTVFSSNPLPIR